MSHAEPGTLPGTAGGNGTHWTRGTNGVDGTIREIETMLERASRYYPADLAPDHYARCTAWRPSLRWSDDGLVRFQPDEFRRCDSLRRELEVSRCHATALLVAERMNDVVLAAQEREELMVRALGILPTSEAGRFREILACADLKPRRVCRTAGELISAVERLGEEFGPATALFYGMLILAGQRQEEEMLKYAERLDRLFDRLVSAPAVITALARPMPDGPEAQFDAIFPTLVAVRERLWQLRPRRLSHEFLITQVIDAYLDKNSGGGNSLGLALLDSIVVGKLGFAVRYFVEDGVVSLQVAAGRRHVYWDVTKPSALSFVPVSTGRRLDLRELFAVAYGSLATMCFTRSMWDKAIDSYGREIELKPESVAAHTSMAICYLRKQMPESALERLRAALEIDAGAPEPYHQVGNAHAMMSNWPRAIDAYKKALRIRPDYAEVYNNLGFAYLRLENPAQAVAAFETAIEHRPDYCEAHYNLGNLYLEQNDAVRAIKCYKDALRLQPNFVGAHYNLGRACYDKHDLDGAIHSYQKAVQLNPKHFGAWHNLGIAYRDKGQTQKAVSALEKAVTINPNLMR